MSRNPPVIEAIPIEEANAYDYHLLAYDGLLREMKKCKWAKNEKKIFNDISNYFGKNEKLLFNDIGILDK